MPITYHSLRSFSSDLSLTAVVVTDNEEIRQALKSSYESLDLDNSDADPDFIL
ncbi:Hypothetical protein CINCED_3A004404, partial [Cinara cedri]